MSTHTEDMKPLLFALADAIETDLGQVGKFGFTGSRKAVLELFEGYSPTVLSGIEHSLHDQGNSVVAADQHIFGNVGAITVIEGQQSTVHCFVYDRSKRPEDHKPFDTFWSRKGLYSWLEGPVKAVYYRSLFDTEWKQLPNGRTRLNNYNKAREAGLSTNRECYNEMWEVKND